MASDETLKELKTVYNLIHIRSQLATKNYLKDEYNETEISLTKKKYSYERINTIRKKETRRNRSDK